MKLVLFADLHLDMQFASLGADQQAARRRRQALRDTLLRIVHVLGERGADALLCAGDLYEHDRVSPDTAQLLRSAFAQLDPIPVFIAPGNHDWYGSQSLYHQVDWSRNVHVFRSNRLEAVTLAEGLTLWGAAHCAPAHTDGFLEHFRVDRNGVHLALFHGSERGWMSEQGAGKAAHAPFFAEQIEPAGLHHVFLGHYHRPRDAIRHTYPGNPHPLTFGEDGDRGVVVVTVASDGSIERERCRVAASDIHDLALDVTGCASQQDVRQVLAERLRGLNGVARVILHGELGVNVDLRVRDLQDTVPWLDGLLLHVGDIRPAYDFAALAEEPTVRGQFVRDVRAAPDLSEEERRRVLATGLRVLEGRDDLEVP